MLIQTYDLLVKNIPYKKMPGYLKSQRINPDLVAISISDDGLNYKPIDWKNYLQYDHKIVMITLCKMDNLFLFVGYSKDEETINYNDGFSKYLLSKSSRVEGKTSVKKQKEKRDILTCLDLILDKVGQFGIDSLSIEEKRELDFLSKECLNK